MGLLIAIHPLRVARMAVQAVHEWLLEEWERFRGELAGRATHSEGIFPFIRILSNVVVRELQTMAIMLDIYLGVPTIYSTFCIRRARNTSAVERQEDLPSPQDARIGDIGGGAGDELAPYDWLLWTTGGRPR